MLRTTLAAAAAVLLGLAAPASGQERDSVVWDFTLENDRWAGGTDRHYTHGTRISRSSAATPQWLRKAASPFRCLACTAPTAFEVELGQEIYTPENTRTKALVVDDRPYAGWAYGALRLAGERDAGARRRVVNEVSVEVGVIGPAAGAERTQALLHRELDFAAARGWHHQLENQLGAVVTYKHGTRMPLGRDGAAFRHDVLPYFEAALGNVRAHAGGGVTWRSGSHLRRSGAFASTSGWRLFADINTRFVARNALLGGTTETGTDYSVEMEPVVATVAAGLEYEARRFSVRFTRERMSREFVGQRDPDEYGSISFSLAP